ncbi:MAG TPA: carbonic anhydrase [Patescibacteria group bacterium]|nr:carbonic anhydrase [Patescibacteria group bacterium]
MADPIATFFTSVGCMDGRVQKAVNRYASLIFGAEFADTVTEAGLVGVFSKKETDPEMYEDVKGMILVSTDKHKSSGIIVHGHENCAGNPVNEEQQKEDIKKTVDTVQEILEDRKIEVHGVYVHLTPRVRIEQIV